MANPCVFCGDDSAQLTDEHVFADWITDFYAERVGKLPYGTVEMGASSGEPRLFRTVPFQQVVKDAGLREVQQRLDGIAGEPGEAVPVQDAGRQKCPAPV